MLRRMSPKLVEEETEELVRVIDNTNNRLKYSGYNFSERLHIIESGILNYRKRKRTSKEKEERMFQTKKKQEKEETKRSWQ